MKRNINWYNTISFIVLLLTAGIFIIEYYKIDNFFGNYDLRYITVLIFAVIIVHLIKAGRLYLALYGTNIGFCKYIKIYSKVTPVSVVFPFKIGELFRMYCYGTQLGSLLRGIVVVVLDRFMDTAALVTIIFIIWIFNGGQMALLTYVLLLFLVFTFSVYFVYPGVYIFWKKYILKAKATEHKLNILKLLELLNNLYIEVINITNGRGVILYLMSLIAWTVEVGCIALLCGIKNETYFSEKISDYLSSALGSGGFSIELNQFVFFSVIFMIVVYVSIKTFEFIVGERNLK